jgi:molybdopterin/thiamine biosynthesis adenylyltransferase
VASDDIDTLDPASLDAFRGELIESGFEPISNDPRLWSGPIHPALSQLTAAETMLIDFQDGWPYRAPKLYVKGIDSDHAVTDGEVCLFQPGEDAMGTWKTFAAYGERIAEWARGSEKGFRAEDALLDAHLYYRDSMHGLATLKLGLIAISNSDTEKSGKLYGHWRDERTLELSTKAPGGEAAGGRWYYRRALKAGPPRDLAALKAALTKGQLANFERRLKNVEGGEPMVFALIWEAEAGRTALALVATKEPDTGVAVKSIELGLEDTEVLALRAGPDVEVLADKRIVVFGCGAVGSNVACRLAEAGAGRLRLIDGKRLRPGHIVRHAASYRAGISKVRATSLQIAYDAPWCDVEDVLEEPWAAGRIEALIADADLVIEATGMGTFAELVSRVAVDAETPMISAALYRGGSVARIRRQIPTVDVALAERTDETVYPLIPPGEEPVLIETGCSALVNNASPIAVAALAASTAEIAIDLLSGRQDCGEELIEIYRPLESAPFDRIGRVSA